MRAALNALDAKSMTSRARSVLEKVWDEVTGEPGAEEYPLN